MTQFPFLWSMLAHRNRVFLSLLVVGRSNMQEGRESRQHSWRPRKREEQKLASLLHCDAALPKYQNYAKVRRFPEMLRISTREDKPVPEFKVNLFLAKAFLSRRPNSQLWENTLIVWFGSRKNLATKSIENILPSIVIVEFNHVQYSQLSCALRKVAGTSVQPRIFAGIAEDFFSPFEIY